MKHLHTLKRMLCKEADELTERLAQKGSISGTDLEHASMLMKTLKNVYRVEGLQDDEYSERGMWTARGYSDRGYSHMEEPHHSERRGRDSRGRYTSYSMNDGQQDMADGIRELMAKENLSSNSKEILRKALEQIER